MQLFNNLTKKYPRLTQISNLANSDLFLVAAVFFISLLVRFAILSLIGQDPLFLMPVVDSREYDLWAGEILNKSFLWTELQYHTPLYPYFLALIYKIFGYNISVAVKIQYLLAGVSNVLVYLLAKKLKNKTTALISVFFMTFYWFFIYTQSFLFCENLSLFFLVLTAYVLICHPDNAKKFLAAGTFFGFCVIARADILLFAGFILIWLLSKKLPIKTTLKYYACFLIPVIIIIAPITLRNYAISKQFFLLRRQVADAAYIGNLPEYKGAAVIAIGKPWEDFASMPNEYYKRNVTETEYEKFFLRKTFDIIKNRPFAWLKLMAQKTYSVWTGREFLRSEDVYFFNRYIAPTPLRFITTPLIFTLALIGMFLTYRQERSKFLPLYLLIICEMFLLFFLLKTRYFVPIFPFLIIFAAYTLNYFYESLKNQKLKAAFAVIIAVIVLQGASFLNPLKIATPNEAEVFYAIAKNFAERRINDQAVVYYNLSLRLNPQNLSVLNDLGLVYLNQGNYEEALKSFTKALQIDQNARKAQLNYELCQKLIAQRDRRKQ